MMKKENESYLSEVISKLTEHKMAMAGLMVIPMSQITRLFVLPLIPYIFWERMLSGGMCLPG